MYNEYLQELRTICRKKRLHLKKIGGRGNYPLYQIILNPQAKTIVCFSAGIHGDEISGPWAILEFLKAYRAKKYPSLKILIYPIANPAGFDMGRRRCRHNKDLNRHFLQKMHAECKLLHQALPVNNLFFFHALHGDPEEKRFYLYYYGKEMPIYRQIIALAKKKFPINNHEKIYGDRADHGLIKNRWDGSFEHRLYKDGVLHCICSETPAKYPLRKRISLNLRMMHAVLKFCQG